jgi:phytoene/squalene synthetase
VLDLLRIGPSAPRDAAETCLAALAVERPGTARVVRALPRELALDLAPCAAWFLAAGEARASPQRLEARHNLTVLSREAQAACLGEAETPLGAALSLSARRRALQPEPFAAHVEALLRELDASSFETRDVLRKHLAGAAQAPGRVLLRALRLETERRRALVDHACRAAWILWRLGRVPDDLAAGVLFVPAEDLLAHRVVLTDLRDRRDGPETAAMLADLGLWARDELDLAWELPLDLGWWRGRIASAGLRLLEARLLAFERARYAALSARPHVGRLRRTLAVLAGLLTRRPPRR